MESVEWMVSLPALMVFSLAGMFAHFLKKNVKGETATEIKGYFRDNLKTTLTALLSTILGVFVFYATLATGQAADVLSAIMVGYTFDSTFNKWENPTGTNNN